MRVVLARPPYSFLYKLIKAKTKQKQVWPPLGLMYIASNLRYAGHEVKIVDAEVDDLTLPQIMNEIMSFNPDVVGVGTATPEFFLASKILEEVKSESKNIITIIGGPHPTVLPEEVLEKNNHIDFVVRHEGEITSVELLNTIENNKELKTVAGISYRKHGSIVHNVNRELIDVNKNPWPARDLIDQKKYLHPIPRKGMCMMTTVQSSRGCPNQCTFCYRMFGHKVRFREPKLFVDEIEYCVDKYNIYSFSFVDDTFTLVKKRVIGICDEISSRGMDISWICWARANTLDKEMLSKMKKAGCIQLSMGVESGNQKILDGVKKGTTLEQYKEYYKLLKEFGFETRGSFMLGLPHETRESIRDTINFAKELALDRAFFNICTPYPGTELYTQALKGNGIRLTTKDWKDFTRWGNAVTELDGITREELIELQKDAMTEFYVRPKIILHYIKAFIEGERAAFYYRPLWYAIKHFLHID